MQKFGGLYQNNTSSHKDLFELQKPLYHHQSKPQLHENNNGVGNLLSKYGTQSGSVLPGLEGNNNHSHGTNNNYRQTYNNPRTLNMPRSYLD